MGLDAVIIADYDLKSLSGSSPLRLNLDDRTAFIQVVRNYLKHDGRVVQPIEGDGRHTWSASMKLNGIFLFSYLTQRGFDVEWIDNYAAEKERFHQLLGQGPRTVIISTTFICAKEDLRNMVEDIRSVAPDVLIIAGGTFVYLSHLILRRSREPIYQSEEIENDFLFFNRNDPAVDLYIISLRGETTLCDVLNRVRKDKALDGIPNTALFSGKDYTFAKQVDDVSNAEDMAIDWTLLPDRVFESGVVPMQASTGCPNKCSFCNFTKDRRLLSVKPLDRLTEELNTVAARGAQYVWFVDDNFRLGRMDLDGVSKHLVKEGPSIQWMSFIRAETLNGVDPEMLRRSGCRELRFGLESGDEQVLKNMNKKAEPAYALQAIRQIRSLGINCTCYFIIGFPGETDETIARTIDFIRSLEDPSLEGLFFWSIYPFMVVPMSPVFEEDMRTQFELTGYLLNWKHRTMDAETAMEYVKKTFFELENSGPIYRGDNMKFLLDLSPAKRHEFVIKRHELSKLALQDRLDSDHVIRSFSSILS